MLRAPYGWFHRFEPSPAERYFNQFFHERPYWLEHQNPLSMANAVGDVIDGEHFSVSVDVSQFAPNELKVRPRASGALGRNYFASSILVIDSDGDFQPPYTHLWVQLFWISAGRINADADTVNYY